MGGFERYHPGGAQRRFRAGALFPLLGEGLALFAAFVRLAAFIGVAFLAAFAGDFFAARGLGAVFGVDVRLAYFGS